MNTQGNKPKILTKRLKYPPKGEIENNEEIWSVNISGFKPAIGNNNLSTNLSAFNKPATYKPSHTRVKNLFKKKAPNTNAQRKRKTRRNRKNRRS